MSCLAFNYNPEVGPLINAIVFSVTKDLLVDLSHIPKNLKDFKIYRALIDTGAAFTAVSDKIIKESKLKQRGEIELYPAFGKPEICKTFFAFIGFVSNTRNPIINNDPVRIGQILSVEACNFNNPSFDLIIGRDILCQGCFTMSHDNHFTICF